ncbi:baseplate J/gp47 family protein [Treponema pectinovorum]|uniref:baseplate J/gp47 family protein n=1 Tax=Treponema pectinovorum TaxID=164 RepID=UPI0011CBAEBE|nr:baseplate J/gp47 family protein [Treponema pectinovorum]
MAFERETLQTLLDRAYNNYMSRLKPLDRTPRHSIIKVLAAVDAGETHQLLGDLSFLVNQIFPDTATGEYLRAHFSLQVPPLYASAATGKVVQTGVAGAAVPKGFVYTSSAGKRYFTSRSYTVGEDGTVEVWVTAEESGSASNLDEDSELTVASALSAGLDSSVKVAADGIAGGVDGETDYEYLSRVIATLRNTTRYGKPGDWAAWAVDSSSEVSKAFEIKLFDSFGTLLIQVINGNQIDGVSQVHNLATVQSYIESVAPPSLFTVQTPELVKVNPTIQLLEGEDTVSNRNLVISRLKVYLNAKAEPGCTIAQSTLQTVIIDGVTISKAVLTLPGGEISTTVLQYPILGDVAWI